MKKSFLKVLILGIMGVSLLYSCKKDETTTTDYVGTWVFSATELGKTVKYSFTFTANTYEITINTDSTLIKGEKGTLSVSGSTLNLTKTELTKPSLSLTNISLATYYKEGSAEFTTALGTSPKSYKGDYTVALSVMKLDYDKNGDGTISLDEKIVLAKQ